MDSEGDSLAVEVAAFAAGHTFNFSGSDTHLDSNSGFGTRLYSDFERACDAAFSEHQGESGISLSDVVDELYSRVYGSLNEAAKARFREMKPALNSLNFEDRYEQTRETVYEHMECILINRLTFGQSNGFIESFLSLYRHGFWPFAWDGDVSIGTFFVYSSATDQTATI